MLLTSTARRTRSDIYHAIPSICRVIGRRTILFETVRRPLGATLAGDEKVPSRSSGNRGYRRRHKSPAQASWTMAKATSGSFAEVRKAATSAY